MSETDPLASYRADISRKREAEHEELYGRIAVNAAADTVKLLGRRVIKVVELLGVKERKQDPSRVKSDDLSLGELEGMNFELSFMAQVDYKRRVLSDDAVKKTWFKQPLHRALTKGIEAWVVARDSSGYESRRSSKITTPIIPDHFKSHPQIYYSSDVGDLNASSGAHEGSQTHPVKTEATHPDFMTVASHVQTCIRFAENKLGIAVPADEKTLPAPDIYDVLAVPKQH